VDTNINGTLNIPMTHGFKQRVNTETQLQEAINQAPELFLPGKPINILAMS